MNLTRNLLEICVTLKTYARNIFVVEQGGYVTTGIFSFSDFTAQFFHSTYFAIVS